MQIIQKSTFFIIIIKQNSASWHRVYINLSVGDRFELNSSLIYTSVPQNTFIKAFRGSWAQVTVAFHMSILASFLPLPKSMHAVAT